MSIDPVSVLEGLDDDALGNARIRDLLDRLGLLAEPFQANRLSGGVSSDIWLIEGAEGPFVLKRPLEKLRVAADWTASLDRGDSEAAWLAFVSEALPGVCPRVLGFDADAHAIALEYVDPAAHANWKSELMAGRVDVDFAGEVGRDLGRIHAESARTPGLAEKFDHHELFESLRVEPYLLRTATVVPGAAEPLLEIVESLRYTRRALVHGDVSPKNILTGQRPIFLDAECATWSDPAFDLAFCRTHLTLKEIHVPGRAAALRSASHALEDAYLGQVDWEDPLAVQARTARLIPALMLARVAGASPVEYLTHADRVRVGELARTALRERAPIEHLLGEPPRAGGSSDTLDEEGVPHG
ncbi:aminoglycoside phosphotransferase family protein [Microbacterium deminutum]|uniref:Aminoglycoside phosphotransferase family protein n=1 Tax=Microbacterium deminutum TaxID=344164 RepID=A0ABP5CGX2_9MICO